MKFLNIVNNYHLVRNSNLKFIRNFNFLNRNINNKNINTNLNIKNTEIMSAFSLNEILFKLNEFAPENLAECWDNVGLLIEPYTSRFVFM